MKMVWFTANSKEVRASSRDVAVNPAFVTHVEASRGTARSEIYFSGARDSILVDGLAADVVAALEAASDE
jgi:hypothetical protein